jgi:YidC/Oxa1 family membrane protein insertase
VDRNTLIALALFAVLFFGWEQYLDWKYPDRHTQRAAPAAEQTADLESPKGDRPSGTPAPSPITAPGSAEQSAKRAPEQTITLERPLYTATLSSYGGALRSWVLRTYDDASRPGRPPVSITTSTREPSLTTPLEELGHGDLSSLPYTVAQPREDTLEFTAEVGGVRIRKTYRLDSDGYGARLSVELENQGTGLIRPEYRVRWPAQIGEGADFIEYGLAAYATDEAFQLAVAPRPSVLGFGGGPDSEALAIKPNAGEPYELDWAGAQTRYFLAAILPDAPREARAELNPVEPGQKGQLDVWFEAVDLPPGAKLSRDYRLYLGPKEADRLDAFGAHLDESIQRGWVPILARWFTAMLTFLHEFVPNYGVAILILTFLIRVGLAPLMVGQMRSMKRMAELAPRMKDIQERYKNDPQKQQEAMLAMYRETGVNPLSSLGGCLPLLLQMPVFVGFYSALQGSIQLRQQPFVGWITDLAQPEALFVIPGIDLPVRVLPLALGAAMVLQQKLTPTPASMDPMQQRMLQVVMPVMMTFMFYQFASGLGLYWLMSTLLGIGQQVWMNREKKPAAA